MSAEVLGAKPVRLQFSLKKGFDFQAHSRAVNGLDAVRVDVTGRWSNPFKDRAMVSLVGRSGVERRPSIYLDSGVDNAADNPPAVDARNAVRQRKIRRNPRHLALTQ